jgi:hypothetical protein
MKKYSEFIESAPLIEHIDTVVTTGDAEYPGTALEVWDQDGRELFHVVVDLTGEKHILFLTGNYRLPLAALEEILAKAKVEVRRMEEPPG